MKKTEQGKKARMIVLGISPACAMTENVEEQVVAMLRSNISKLSAEVVDGAENAGLFENFEGANFFVLLRKFNAELRVLEKIKQLNFEVISRKLA